MACVLYREGTGTIEHGIECESTVCEPFEVEGLLNAGWLQNPPGYVAPEPVIEAEEEDEEESEELSGEEVQELFDSLAEQNRLITAERDRLSDEVLSLNGELAKSKADLDAKDQEILALTEELRVAKLPVEESEEEEETKEEDSAESNDAIRAAAKAAGIEGWDTKRIKTLKAALAELE